MAKGKEYYKCADCGKAVEHISEYGHRCQKCQWAKEDADYFEVYSNNDDCRDW